MSAIKISLGIGAVLLIIILVMLLIQKPAAGTVTKGTNPLTNLLTGGAAAPPVSKTVSTTPVTPGTVVVNTTAPANPSNLTNAIVTGVGNILGNIDFGGGSSSGSTDTSTTGTDNTDATGTDSTGTSNPNPLDDYSGMTETEVDA